jgi:segregation and condensation protein A
VIVGELDLDLEAFEGPFDLLLTLVLKDELPAGDVDVAAIVLEFCERLAERDELDLEACGEFLVLVAGLLELKVRALFGLGEGDDVLELDPDEAAADLAARLAEYRRIREAASWLAERLAEERFFRVGPNALAPVPARRLATQDPARLGEALRSLAVEPPSVSLSHMALRFPPVSLFLERFRSVLRRRSRFDFDGEVDSLSRVEQAVAFLALLELRKRGEVTLSQAEPFAPIRVARSAAVREEVSAWSARSA